MANAKNVSVEDLIDSAIIAGFQRGAHSYLESVEDALQTSLIIQESGDASSLLQAMLDESVSASDSKLTTEHLEDLSSKMKSILV